MPLKIGIIGAGALGAAGSVAGAAIQSQGASQAAGEQVALGQQALTVQQQLSQQGLQTLLSLVAQGQTGQAGYVSQGMNALRARLGQVQGTLNPVIGAGETLMAHGEGVSAPALATLQKLLTPGANQTAELNQIPGFEFAQTWGQNATRNQGTTMGLGGNTLTAGANYATGLAEQNFGNVVSGLQGLANTGVAQTSIGANLTGSSANQLASSLTAGGVGALNALSGAGNTQMYSLAGAGASGFSGLNQAGSMLGSTLGGIGSSMAAGTLGSANALSGGLTGASGSISNALMLSSLLKGGTTSTANPTVTTTPDLYNFSG